MYVRLNLATNPLLSHRRFLAGSALVGILGLFLFVGLGWRAYNLRKAEENLRVRNSKIQKEMAAAGQERDELQRYFAQQEAAGFQDHAKFVVGVLQARSINWTQMFMDLEKTLPPGSRIVRIEPRLDKGVVTVKFVVGAATDTTRGNANVAVYRKANQNEQDKFVVTWTSTGNGGDLSGSGVFARVFAVDGTPLSDAFRVNSSTTGHCPTPTTPLDGNICIY